MLQDPATEYSSFSSFHYLPSHSLLDSVPNVVGVVTAAVVMMPSSFWTREPLALF